MEKYQIKALCRKFPGLSLAVRMLLNRFDLTEWPTFGHIKVSRIDAQMLTERADAITDISNPQETHFYRIILWSIYPLGALGWSDELKEGETTLDHLGLQDQLFCRRIISAETELVNGECVHLLVRIHKLPKDGLGKLIREIEKGAVRAITTD